MISCQQVAQLLTTDQLPAQNFWKRMQVKLHLFLCRYCALLLRQVQQLGSAARSVRGSVEAEKTGADLEARLLQKLGLKKE